MEHKQLSPKVCGGAGTMNGGSPDSTTPLKEGVECSPPPEGAPNMYSLKWNTQLLSLQRSLANLWDSGIGTDCVLLCQGTPLPVHKIVLISASPYVAAVVQTMAQGSHLMPVIVVDIPAEAGKALLSFLYCGEAHVPVTVIPHLVIGAKFLGISGFGDPGVLESLTSIVPESVMTPDKTPPPSCHSPHQSNNSSSSFSPQVQIPSNKTNSPYPGNVLQFKSHQHLHAQIGGGGVGKARLPYPSPYSTSSTTSSTSCSSGGEVINLSNPKRSSSSSAYSPAYSHRSTGSVSKSPKSSAQSQAGLFIGTTSILDNLLKNPRTHLEAAIAAAAAAAQQHHAESGDNAEMVQYEAEGYLERCRSPHNLSLPPHLRQTEDERGKGSGGGRGGGGGYYPGRGGGGGGAATEDDDNNNNMEMTMTEDSTPIPPHLLEPNIEYHIGAGDYSSIGDRFGNLHNPLADLAKVAAASMRHPTTGGGNKRGSKKQPAVTVDHNGEISSTAPPKPKPKKNESIICDICSKKFSNAYNLRVHMEGHSGQVFVCSVCSHASRSRDALRKHFAYRHRELWISGMSAFRKNVPGRKLSISRNNNNADVVNNNNVFVKGEVKEEVTGGGGGGDGGATDTDNTASDSNVGSVNIRGGDGSLTISEAK